MIREVLNQLPPRMSSHHMLEGVKLGWTESAGKSPWTDSKCLEIVRSSNAPKKEYIFYFSNYRCLPAGGWGGTRFLLPVYLEQFVCSQFNTPSAMHSL